MKRALVLIAAVLGAVAASWARQPAPDALSLVARLPAPINTILVSEGLHQVLAEPVLGTLAPLLPPAEAWPGIRAGWAKLSERLGWTQTEAMEHLMGRRVVLALEVKPGGGARWALLAVIDAEVERRLRARLEVAPRAIVNNKPVLSVEGGVYLLATSAPAGGREVTILLAPGGDEGLFDRLLPVLAPPVAGDAGPGAGGDGVGATIRGWALRDLKPGQVAVIRYAGRAKELAADDAVAVRAGIERGEIRLELALRDAGLAGARAEWPPASGSVVAGLNRPDAHVLAASAVLARASGPARVVLKRLLALTPSGGGRGGADGWVCVETATPGRAGRVTMGERLPAGACADPRVAELLAGIEGGGLGAEPMAQQLAGVASDAPRATRITPARGWWGSEVVSGPVLAEWRQTTVGETPWVVVEVGATSSAPGDAGPLASLVRKGERAEVRRWLAEIDADPRAVWSALGALELAPPPMRAVRGLRLGLWIEDDGAVRGRAAIRLDARR